MFEHIKILKNSATWRKIMRKIKAKLNKQNLYGNKYRAKKENSKKFQKQNIFCYFCIRKC